MGFIIPAVSYYTPPKPIGEYSESMGQNKSPADRKKIREKLEMVDRYYRDLATQLAVEPPQRGTRSGDTSTYMWGSRNILLSEDLLLYGSDLMIKKIAAHEFFHAMQHMKHKPMWLTFLREPEAEAHALKYALTGVAEEIPWIYDPTNLIRNDLADKFEAREGASAYKIHTCHCMQEFNPYGAESVFTDLSRPVPIPECGHEHDFGAASPYPYPAPAPIQAPQPVQPQAAIQPAAQGPQGWQRTPGGISVPMQSFPPGIPATPPPPGVFPAQQPQYQPLPQPAPFRLVRSDRY
jgi:hypothetical protein